MKQFLENILHQQVEIKSYCDTNRLPLILKGNYNLFVLTINGQNCIIAEPREELGLATLRRQQRKLEQLTEQYCVLYLRKLTTYPRNKMLEEGIPFIWENHQIYMPFLGLLLSQNETRALKPCVKISFLTQKLLLMMLYNQWEKVTVTMAAEFLDVTKTSITRCFDEIESLEIPVLCKKGRTRVLCGYVDKKKMWDLIKPYMRNPLLQEFYLEEDLTQGLLESGISALCRYSMLEDNAYKTCAIIKSQIKELSMKNRQYIPKNETPGCIIQELGYVINYKDSGAIDPLTVLMLMEAEREEPRIDKALEEMLEDYIWSRD